MLMALLKWKTFNFEIEHISIGPDHVQMTKVN